MSKLDAWDNTDDMEREDVASIIDDRNSTIKQYRNTVLGDSDGFEEQTPRQSVRFLRNLKGRIDRRDRVYNPNRTDVSRSVEHLFIATVYGRDVIIDDVLELDNQRYVVTWVNPIAQSFTEAECRVDT